MVVGCALAFAAGVFLCISLADLLPEVTFHTHDRMRLTTFLLLGVTLAYGIGYLEPVHSHGHAPAAPILPLEPSRWSIPPDGPAPSFGGELPSVETPEAR
jgi:hypothetical protein